jgi:hypothetical protein
VSITFPDELIPMVEEAAKRRHLSLEKFVETVLLSQSTAVISDPYLESRASRATGKGWDLLDQVPPAKPDLGDELD